MGFKALFPFFNRTELAPSEIDNDPDVDSKFNRSVSRLEVASNIKETFMFLRGDFNGRLHVTETPTDFDNTNAGTKLSVVGQNTIVPANPDRQVILIANEGIGSVSLVWVKDGLNLFSFGLLPGDIIELRGFTQQLDMSSTAAGITLRFLEV